MLCKGCHAPARKSVGEYRLAGRSLGERNQCPLVILHVGGTGGDYFRILNQHGCGAAHKALDHL